MDEFVGTLIDSRGWGTRSRPECQRLAVGTRHATVAMVAMVFIFGISFAFGYRALASDHVADLLACGVIDHTVRPCVLPEGAMVAIVVVDLRLTRAGIREGAHRFGAPFGAF